MNELVVSNDGSHTVRSEKFGVLYHSHHGSIQESIHVFIKAGLEKGILDKKECQVLEMGFGTGLNALLTYQFSFNQQCKISYTGYEAFPIGWQLASHLNYQSLLELDDHVWVDFKRMHEEKGNLQLSPRFDFNLVQGRMEDLEEENVYDVVYYDAFAPTTQPELWGEAALRKMFMALKSGGILTTYCAQGAVKRTLKSVGFTIEAIPGPVGKREMTRAYKP